MIICEKKNCKTKLIYVLGRGQNFQKIGDIIYGRHLAYFFNSEKKTANLQINIIF